jgi:DNA-binding winged helix-turn-helix (wHTH) protein/Tol biopolymer transport system component
MSSRDADPAEAPTRREYRFGDFTLDLDRGFLRRGADEVPLRPKTFEVLTYLVERHGRLVPKAELIDAIWPDAAVTENSVAQCLLEIRRALADESQQMIRTVARRGYIFTAPVSAATLPFARASERVSPEERPAVPAPALPNRLVPSRVAGKYWVLSIVFVLAVGAAGVVSLRLTRPAHDVIYTQLTNFTDSATNPALSPDGRMLAFLRGSRTFLDPGQLYVKMLPDGEPVPLTHDDRLKMAPVFSSDGARIAYTATTPGSGAWETWIVPVLGGDPRPMLANAAALSWVGDGRVLFSEIKRGLQMGIVTATLSRSEVRDVYVPQGMAHRSYASPDRRWVLIASEMNASGWLPCRMAPIDGSGQGRIVGPPDAKCTYAAWSPDGQWMYFSAEAGGGFHTWRQKFPDGPPEQMTFGATDEEGIAMWPDGRSFASSVGTSVSAIWVHDGGQDYQITSEGYGHIPSFSADGRTLYYLLRVSDVEEWAAGELWAVDLSTHKRRRLLPEISMAYYEVSADGARIVFARTDRGKEGVWVGHLDGGHPLVQLTSESDTRALFGSTGTVIFEAREAGAKYLFHVREDGSNRQKVTADPITSLKAVSPDRHWAVVGSGDDARRRLVAYPLHGGSPLPICENCSDSDGGPDRGRTPPTLSWSPSGDYVYLRLHWPSEPVYENGKTYVLQLAEPSTLPPAFTSEAEVASLPGVQLIPHGGIFPGPDPSLYAYTRAATHRNIYRISVP